MDQTALLLYGDDIRNRSIAVKSDSTYVKQLAAWSIYDRKALFAKGSSKSEEFKRFNGFFLYFLWLTMSKICVD